MVARKKVVGIVLALTAPSLAAVPAASYINPASYVSVAIQGGSQSSADSSAQSSPSSSNPKMHRHHVTVAEEVGPDPDITKAEAFIQKKDFTQAESVLQKKVESDPGNYVAWFDLGFVENALGKGSESIAAYRKSVAAKPDVFESNLNLGLQLVKTRTARRRTILASGYDSHTD